MPSHGPAQSYETGGAGGGGGSVGGVAGSVDGVSSGGTVEGRFEPRVGRVREDVEAASELVDAPANAGTSETLLCGSVGRTRLQPARTSAETIVVAMRFFVVLLAMIIASVAERKIKAYASE
ncbi:MAG: hypothetical protein HYU52_12600 [Acidobacteria bacterium]|nr:hypothetical protein [Acidobacteriota bacterium]